MSDRSHLIGLLLGTEQDWPTAFEAIMRRLGPVTDAHDDEHTFDVERMTIEPFNLRDKPRHELVIDRLAYWYYHPREWLKKAALMDDVYLLNSPFTFQSMEKHAAYCAMMRLGLHVPETVLVPFKNPPDHAKYAYTAERYNQPFDLDAVAESIGYPMFMKPYDGGAWVGVSHLKTPADLHRAYDESGQRLMHLQKAVDGYDVFARSLSIGAETMVMNFDPDQPMHGRYSVGHDFLDAEHRPGGGHHRPARQRLLPLGVQLLRDVDQGRRRLSHRLRQRLPRRRRDQPALLLPVGDEGAGQVVGVLHRHRPLPRYDLDTRRYFEISDRDDLSYEREAGRVPARWPTTTSRSSGTPTSAPADSRTSTTSCSSGSAARLRPAAGAGRAGMFPPHEHDQFVAHFRGLLGLWVQDETARLSA